MDIKNYNQCVDLYSDRVYRFILKSNKDESEAKDIVQDAFLRLWESHLEVDFNKSRSWLFTTAYRIMIDGMRRSKKMSRMEEHHPQPIHESNWSDLQSILHQALNELPEVQRQVILLRDYEGYSYEEIGEITSLNPSQVKVYIFRGRKTLKDYLVSIDKLI